MNLDAYSQSIADYYSFRSVSYDRGALHPRLVQALVAGAALARGQRVLDLATGTGLVALAAAELVGPEGRVVGVDISEGMLEQAREKIRARKLQHLELLQADAETAELPESSFDCAFCSSALIFMKDIPAAVRRWARFLKHGGTFAFDFPAPSAFVTGVVLKNVAAQHGVELRFSSYDAEWCTRLLRDAGFGEITQTTEQFGNFIALESALRGWDEVGRNPLLRALAALPAAELELCQREYAAELTRLNTDRGIWNDVAMHFTYGKRA